MCRIPPAMRRTSARLVLRRRTYRASAAVPLQIGRGQLLRPWLRVDPRPPTPMSLSRYLPATDAHEAIGQAARAARKAGLAVAIIVSIRLRSRILLLTERREAPEAGSVGRWTWLTRVPILGWGAAFRRFNPGKVFVACHAASCSDGSYEFLQHFGCGLRRPSPYSEGALRQWWNVRLSRRSGERLSKAFGCAVEGTVRQLARQAALSVHTAEVRRLR